jgi:myosin heavy subunit
MSWTMCGQHACSWPWFKINSLVFILYFSHDQDLLGSTVSRMGSTSGATVPRGTSKGKPTVSDTFRHQLQALVDVLQATNPW